ncbi:alanine--tRNA ligase [bacterium]|nr:alanine--tRNA ligase [bacterium]
MESARIRELYLKFFEGKGHKVVKSSSLIPFDDPTLLFTNAGMVQFKKFWATEVPLPYKRATSCQKCVRAGGKDSDLEKIGYSGRHHTFFEMLGNFSFGDYFKKEAIEWAFEFVVGVLKIPEELIWISYYEKDEETKNFWKKFIPEEKIIPLGEKDNFWGPAGDTGPCGPCTELYIDLGPEKSCGRKDCKPGCDCERFLEFWNLVFPQFDKQIDGSLKPLKRRGVDTGMGLERMARIMQKTPSNYETDLFLPIIKELEKISHLSYEDRKYKPFFRIVSDHIRAIVFIISDNVIPSNEGRGYVLRRILRRACLSGLNLNIREPFLYTLSRVPVKLMKDTYPSLEENQKLIEKVIFEEEEKFHFIISSARKIFDEFAEEVKNNVLDGNTAFKLYDTYGIPKDLLEELALQRNIKIDWKGFEENLEKQKKRSRFSTEIGISKKKIFEKKPLVETIFTGYEKLSEKGKVFALYSDEKKKLFHIIVDKTPFYPEKGGQIGDRGIIENENIKFVVVDTQIDEKGLIYHSGKFEKGGPENIGIDTEVFLKVNPEFRKKVSINHTSTHLLHYALRKIVGEEVKQAGSYVGDDKLRFDFVCFSEIDEKIVKKVENLVQEKIFENSSVSVEEMTLEEELEKGAVALFLEKYGEKVRVVSNGDYHSEVCGGTHLKNTGDIYLFKIIGFSSIGRNLKRIEAITYKEALSYLENVEKTFLEIAEKLETDTHRIIQRVDKLIAENKEKDKLIEKYENLILDKLVEEIIKDRKILNFDGNEVSFIGKKVNVERKENVSKLADKLIEKLENGVVFLGCDTGERIFVVIKVGERVKDKISAVKLIKEISPLIKGGGGGSDVFAQGSGKAKENFNHAVEKIINIIRRH